MSSNRISEFISYLRREGLTAIDDVSGADFTTYRLGGNIDHCVKLSTHDELKALSRIISESFPNVLNRNNVFIAGNGSNLLIDDAGFRGILFLLQGEFEQIIECVFEADDLAKIKVGAAMKLPLFARRLASEGISGLTFYVGIPGTIGGAVAMNAGGHGCQTSEVLKRAEVLNLITGEMKSYANEECNFEYRHSVFEPTDLIYSASFIGKKAQVDNLKEQIDEIVSWRRENQPGGRNVGSVFQNPVGESAGSLIEKCGLKGFTIGGASVSEKHANFIQADQNATSRDVLDLIKHVQTQVFESTGYRLETEVRYISNYE